MQSILRSYLRGLLYGLETREGSLSKDLCRHYLHPGRADPAGKAGRSRAGRCPGPDYRSASDRGVALAGAYPLARIPARSEPGGHSPIRLACLILRPSPLLEQFTASIWRLLDQAYHAIQNSRINEFDQIQINTFFRRPRIWNRSIQIHLRPATYHRYRQVWQRLISGVA